MEPLIDGFVDAQNGVDNSAEKSFESGVGTAVAVGTSVVSAAAAGAMGSSVAGAAATAAVTTDVGGSVSLGAEERD